MSVRINNKIKYKIKILVKFVFQSPNLQIFHSFCRSFFSNFTFQIILPTAKFTYRTGVA